MPTFPSVAWAEAFKDTLNQRQPYRQAARGLSARFVFHVQAEGPLAEDQFLAVLLDDGECVEVGAWDPAAGPEADFVLRGRYPKWVALLKGEFDPVQAVLTRQLEVRGNLSRLMRYVGAARQLAQATTDVETHFL